MNDKSFEELLNEIRLIGGVSTAYHLSKRDTTQREALARVEGERDAVRSAMRRQSERHDELLSMLELVTNQRDTAQAQLAEAMGLLERLSVYKPQGICAPTAIQGFAIEAAAFLARNIQAERQEAQGAQAGDDHDQVHQLAFEVGEPDEDGDGYHFSAEQLDEFVSKLNRAALATQPAAGEPVAPKRCATIRVNRLDSGRYAPKVMRFDAGQFPDGELIDVYAAQPAAAHGDEAATLVKALSLLWEATNFLPRGGSMDGRVSAFLAQHAPEPVASAAAAHGDEAVFLRLPNEKHYDHSDGPASRAAKFAWNNCIAEIKELNPGMIDIVVNVQDKV